MSAHVPRRWRRVLVACALALVVAGCTEPSARDRPVSFTPVADGVEYARFRGVPGVSGPFEGHAFRVDLESAGLRLLPAGGPSVRREVSVIARSLPQAVALNASFFDEKDRAMGLVVDQGRVVSRGRIRKWGALVVEKRRARVVTGDEVDLERLPDLVVQGTPRLVIDGRVPKLKPQEAQRTAVCADGSRVTFVVVTSRVDATAFARFLARPRSSGGLGCSDALNLDGGPSTQLSARLGELSVSVPGGWGVPNALVAIPGLPETSHPAPARPEKDAGAPAAEASAPDRDGGR